MHTLKSHGPGIGFKFCLVVFKELYRPSSWSSGLSLQTFFIPFDCHNFTQMFIATIYVWGNRHQCPSSILIGLMNNRLALISIGLNRGASSPFSFLWFLNAELLFFYVVNCVIIWTVQTRIIHRVFVGPTMIIIGQSFVNLMMNLRVFIAPVDIWVVLLEPLPARLRLLFLPSQLSRQIINF